MRSVNIFDDINQILSQYAAAIPDVFLKYSGEIYVVPGDEAPSHEDGEIALFDICIGLDEDSEEVIGEITLFEDFTALYEIFDEEDDFVLGSAQ